MYADDNNIAWLRLDINKLRILKTSGLWRTTVMMSVGTRQRYGLQRSQQSQIQIESGNILQVLKES